MKRPTKEWSSENVTARVPPRVRDRVSERQGNACALCTRSFSKKLPVEIDHKVPLILGGEHREKNFQALCRPCHLLKTKAEVKIKSKVAKARQDRKGIKRDPQIRTGRRFNGDPVIWNPETKRWENYVR